MSGIIIREWREMRRGSLLGFCKVQMASGMVLNDCTVLTGTNGPWASAPSKPMLGRDGTALTDNNGKTKYSPVVEFADKATRERWSAAVVEALRAAHPEAFQ